MSAVMPIDFTTLVWAAIFGFFFFDEVPDIWLWLGGFMIFASTTYIAHREQQAKKEEAKIE